MYPAIGTGSLILSIVFGVLIGAILASLLRRLSAWVLAFVAVVAVVLAPFAGHGTWLVGFSGPPGSEPTVGIHLQYVWTAMAIAMGLIAIWAMLAKRQVARAA